jgi:hypothetical protein
MRNPVVGMLLAAFLLWSAAGCSSGVDRKKFDGALKAAQAVQNSIENLDDYEKFGKVFDLFANEVIALRDKVSNDKERKLLGKYEDLLMTYQDGFQLWEYKVESTRYSWIPEGVIYLEPKIKALALKYRLPVQSHLVELTRHEWKSVPADSLKIIWERARAQFKALNS